MHKTSVPFEITPVSEHDIQNAIARARVLQSQEIARLLRAAGSELRRLAGTAMHVRFPAAGRSHPVAH